MVEINQHHETAAVNSDETEKMRGEIVRILLGLVRDLGNVGEEGYEQILFALTQGNISDQEIERHIGLRISVLQKLEDLGVLMLATFDYHPEVPEDGVKKKEYLAERNLFLKNIITDTAAPWLKGNRPLAPYIMP